MNIIIVFIDIDTNVFSSTRWSGRAAPGLPEAHRGAEGVAVCEGGALHDAADRCKFGPPLGQQKGTAGAQQLDKLAVTLFIPRNCFKIC